jgi:hypothetical protein
MEKPDLDSKPPATSPLKSSTLSCKIREDDDNGNDARSANYKNNNKHYHENSIVMSRCGGSELVAKIANKVEVATNVVPEKIWNIEDSTMIENTTTLPVVPVVNVISSTNVIVAAAKSTSSKTAGHPTAKGPSSTPASTSLPHPEPLPPTTSTSVSPAHYGTRDVLFGRGVPIQRHFGNRRMHQIVSAYRERYRHASRADKTVLVRATIQDIRQGGTRFLKRAEGNDHVIHWIEVTDDAVYEKISHALRGNGNGNDPRNDSPKRKKMKDIPEKAPTRSHRESDGPSSISNSAIISSATNSDVAVPPPESGVLTKTYTTHSTNSLPIGQLLNALTPRLSQQDIELASTLTTVQSLVAAQLLQNQLIPHRQQHSFQGSTTGLEMLLANNYNQQHQLGGAGSTATNLNSLLGLFQQQPRLAEEDPSKQLLNQLLLSGGNQGTVVSAWIQLLQNRQQQQQQQQQQQARVQLLRQVQQELAGQRLAVTTPQGISGTLSQAQEQHQHQPSLNQNALLLSLLLGNINNAPVTSPSTSSMGSVPDKK